MTWFIILYLTKPIQKIIDAVKPYQEGTQHILPAIKMGSINPKSDFAKLALTLNSLSAKIQNHIDNLTDERNEKKAILESLVEGVVAVDENLAISYVNNMANKLLNISQGFIGQNFKAVEQTTCLIMLQDCQRENKPLSETLELYQEGKKVYLDLVAAPKKEKGGAVLVIQDKTAHYKLSEMRRDFIANASHELKTPITIIHGFAEALHDNPTLPLEVRTEVTAKIVRNCQRMGLLIKDLLTLADVENIPTSRLIHCNIDTLIDRCCAFLLEAFPDTEIRIEKNQADSILIGDPSLLELAIMNLLENASKYSSKPAKINIKITSSDEQVKIAISDRGIGIPLSDQEHIFDRFYTVDKAHSQKMGGSGLGLSIVKTIIEKHFGTISLFSEIGKGTTFTIVLPKRSIDIEQ